VRGDRAQGRPGHEDFVPIDDVADTMLHVCTALPTDRVKIGTRDRAWRAQEVD
jgi:hypothetical protein